MKTIPRVQLIVWSTVVLFLHAGCGILSRDIGWASAPAPMIIQKNLPLKYFYGDLKGEKVTKTKDGKYMGSDGLEKGYYLTEYNNAANDPDPDKQRTVRNEIVFDLMAAIDQGFYGYEKVFKAGFAAKDVLVDSTRMAVDLTSTVIVPAQTKTVLSAVAAGLGGVNASIDKNYFDQKSAEIVMLEMRSLRKTKADDIITKITGDPTKTLHVKTSDGAAAKTDGAPAGGAPTTVVAVTAAPSLANPAPPAGKNAVVPAEGVLAAPGAENAGHLPATPRSKTEGESPKCGGLSIADYPLSEAMRDLLEYYQCGSLTNALISLQQKAAKPSATNPAN
jgi:hypothetical protein